MSKASDYTSVDIFKDYQTEGGILPSSVFHEICEEFNEKLMHEIIYNARVANLGWRLSTLEVVKVDRNFSKQAVNWVASEKLKQRIIDEGGVPYSKEHPEGEKWFVYYTDDYFIRFNWNKSECIIPNKTAYKFTATRGDTGNKDKLKHYLKENPLAHLKYRHIK